MERARSADLAYLVERYLSPTDSAELESAVVRLTRACQATLDTATPVHYLHSTLVPAEDTCFCLFQAPSSEAVRALNQRAGFALDRIVEAALLPVDGTAVSGLRP